LSRKKQKASDSAEERETNSTTELPKVDVTSFGTNRQDKNFSKTFATFKKLWRLPTTVSTFALWNNCKVS